MLTRITSYQYTLHVIPYDYAIISQNNELSANMLYFAAHQSYHQELIMYPTLLTIDTMRMVKSILCVNTYTITISSDIGGSLVTGF